MSKIVEYIAAGVIAVLLLIAIYLLYGLIVWAVGLLVCRVFNIDYAFTYWQAFAIGVVLELVGSAFKTRIQNK